MTSITQSNSDAPVTWVVIADRGRATVYDFAAEDSNHV